MVQVQKFLFQVILKRNSAHTKDNILTNKDIKNKFQLQMKPKTCKIFFQQTRISSIEQDILKL